MSNPLDEPLLDAIDDVCEWLEYDDLPLGSDLHKAIKKLNHERMQYRIRNRDCNNPHAQNLQAQKAQTDEGGT